MIDKKELSNKISKSKTLLFTIIAISCFLIVSVFDFFDQSFSLHDILVEFHGLVFDLVIFGILITTYETISSKKEKIERYNEELSDYKFWKSEESMYRTRGIIKRLVSLGEKKLDLSFCYLANDNSLLRYTDMEEWNFTGATLTNCGFGASNMTNSNFSLAKLNRGTFTDVNLTNSNFRNTNLYQTKFENCNLTNVDFFNARVDSISWFSELKKSKNIGVEVLKNIYFIEETKNEFTTNYRLQLRS